MTQQRNNARLPSSVLGVVYGWLTPNQVVRVCRLVCKPWAQARPHWRELRPAFPFDLSRLENMCEMNMVQAVRFNKEDVVRCKFKPHSLRIVEGGQFFSPSDFFNSQNQITRLVLTLTEFFNSQNQITRLVLTLTYDTPLDFLLTLENLESLEIFLGPCGLKWKEFPTLISLAHLHFHDLEDLDAITMLTKWKNLRRLGVTTDCTIQGLYCAISKLVNLTELVINSPSYTTMESFQQLTQMKSFTFSAWCPADEVCKLLHSMPKLESFIAPQCMGAIFPRSLAVVHFAGLSSSAWLELQFVKEVLVRNLTWGKQFSFPLLMSLTVTAGSNPAVDLQLIGTLASLQNLDYTSNLPITSIMITNLSGLCELRTLSLSFAALGRKASKSLGGLAKMHKLSLHSIVRTEIAAFVRCIRVSHLRFHTLSLPFQDLKRLLVLPDLEKFEVKSWTETSRTSRRQPWEIPCNVEFR